MENMEMQPKNVVNFNTMALRNTAYFLIWGLKILQNIFF